MRVQKIIFIGTSSVSVMLALCFYKAATAAQSTLKVLPVPVGLSIRAFWPNKIL